MRVRVLQHVPFEGIGSMAAWLSGRGAEVQYTRFFESPELPDPRGIGLVIAMGGPMSVKDEAQHPWLRPEKAFIREVLRRGIAVVGVCLGAQLIASALGAKVYPNAEKEIGWFPVAAVETAADVFRFPREATVFHWHGETFDLPPGAVRLAGSAGCRNQAFQIGKNGIGLQFHLETTPESADRIIRHCRGDIVSGPYIQTEAAMRGTPASAYHAANRLMGDLLSYVTRPAG
ncbi:type 1 glutamine amidotransferase [Desulfococcus sp.]|uniref:type 1 glutamine amidotransferase n=1 Tax=Desulfococcus sp. TaxID=2025834 RepID=UPI00359417A0